MWDRADSSFFTFRHLGATGAKTGVVWVLLDTVLQQLDAGKRAQPEVQALRTNLLRSWNGADACSTFSACLAKFRAQPIVLRVVTKE